MADILDTVFGGNSSSQAPAGSGDILETVFGKSAPVPAPVVKQPVKTAPAPDVNKLIATTKPTDTSKIFGDFFSSTPIAPKVSMGVASTTPLVLKPGESEVNPYSIPGEIKPVGESLSAAKPRSLWDKAITGIQNTLFNESNGRDTTSKAVQSSIVDSQLVDIAGQLGIDKKFPLDPKLDTVTATYNQKKEITAYMKSNWEGIRQSLTKPDALPAHPEMLGPTFSDVSKNLESYTKEMGVRSTPSNHEIISTVLSLPVAGALIEAPVAGVIGLAAFTALGQVEHYFLGDTAAGKIADKLGLNSGTKEILNLVELFAEGAALHSLYLKAPDVATKFTKNIVETYAPGKSIYFSGEKVRDIWQTGTLLSEAEKNDILKIIPENKKSAFKNGITVDIPAEKVLTLVDKPYWGKIKDFLGVRTRVQEISRTSLGEAKAGAEARPNRLLGEGVEKTQQHVETLHKEINNAVETHGADATHMALVEKLGVDSMTASEIIQESQAPKTSLEIQKASDDLLAELAPKEESLSDILDQLFAPSNEPKSVKDFNIPENVQEKADTDWTNNYADKHAELSDKISELSKQMDTAPKTEVATLKKEHNALMREQAKVEDAFVKKWREENIVDDKASVEMNKRELKKAGFGEEAMGFGESADVFSIGGKPAVALSWMDEGLSGFSVAKDFRGKGIATKYLAQLMQEEGGTLKVVDANPEMLKVLNKIGEVSEPNGEGVVTVTKKAEMSEKDRKAAIDDIKGSRVTSSLEETVEKLVTGKLKIGISNTQKTEIRSILGGHYPNIMRNSANLDSIDEVAHQVGVTPEELAHAYIKRKSNSGMLYSGFDPGVDQFLEDDVMPAAGKALEGLKNIMASTVHLVTPTLGVKAGDLDLIMKMKGVRDKQEYIFSKTHEIIKKNFDKMPQKDQVAFIDKMKRGQPQATPALQAVADSLRKIDTAMWEKAKEFKPTLAWKENHFRVLWKTIPGSTEAKGFKGVFRRPLQGTKGFTKQSTLIDMSEGIEKGGVPISYNPIDLFSMAYADMNKFITAQEMIAGLKNYGQMKFVRFGKNAPDGFVKIDDSIAKKYISAKTTYTDKDGNPFPTVAQTGEWHVEENVGRILNNFLSKDHIRSTDLGRGLLALKNAYTAVELSLSPFHAVFESLETMGSSIGLGIQKLTQGNAKGLKDIATSPAAPFTTARTGGKAIRYLTEKGFLNTPEGKSFIKEFPNAATLLDDLFIGGGKMKMDQGYEITTTETFLNNVASGNYVGAMLRLLPSLNKTLTKPLFEIYIPRLKIGTFLNEYSNDLVANFEKLSTGEMTRGQLARERWNFVEDRFGEMNFDNLFWNKTFKTAMQLMFRSATWKIGNLRATGGAIWGQGKELFMAARQGRAPRMNPKMAWLLGMSVVTVVIGTLMQKTMTGKSPTTVKDIIYPQIDDKGNRVSTPTYWKDAFHLVHDPAGYLTSSLSGDLSRVAEIWQNQDFYGTEIMSPSDPFYKKAIDGMIHMAPVPFIVSSGVSLNQSGAPVSKQALSFFGFSKAPGYINNSEIQNKIYDLYDKRTGGVKTQEDAATAKQKSDIKKAYQNGDIEKANTLLNQAVSDGVIKETGIKTFIENADLPGDIKAFRMLPDADQRMLFRDMTLEELTKYSWYATSDVKAKFSEISDTTAEFVQAVKDGDVKQPIYKGGAEVSDDSETPTFQNNKQTSTTSLIGRVVAYAEAIGTDPVTAFSRIFTGQMIREVRNGTIIVERMPFSESTSIKKAQGGAKGMNLDHIVPLEIGGDNSKDNLQLIPQDQWKSNTAVENYLGKELKAGNLTGKQVREFAIRFKAGLGEILSPELMKEYADKYGSKPMTADEILNYSK